MTYLFKDTDRAARRLQVLAEVYAPSSETFLHAIVDPQPRLALDLGCGSASSSTPISPAPTTSSAL